MRQPLFLHSYYVFKNDYEYLMVMAKNPWYNIIII